MADLSTVTLPVLPLTTGVVLPGMVLTVALETTEAQVAAKAAGDDGHLLLVPRVDGRYASVGVIARIESTGTLPNGTSALVIRAINRARVGSGVVGAGEALWLTADPVEEGEPTERGPRAGPRAAGHAPRASPSTSVVAASTTCCRASTSPARWPTPPAGGPTSTSSARSSCWRRPTSPSGSRRSWPGPRRRSPSSS